GLTTDMSLTGWDLINAVRTERRLELAFEGDRLYDLRRWKDQAGKPVIEDVLGPNGSFVKYNTQLSTDVFETHNTIETQSKGANFNPAIHLLWPIPTSEIVASGGVIKQNPGY
ncbi:MAG TPA: RagB/SusD family nutrient uptake outer membrane protein, partial [Puia sp.]|nr:RagB/SusD family nutrient uptake outer membrane protein [Puia sp.]